MTDVPNPKPAPRWWNTTVLGIGAASFFNDVGHEMATTAMPVLLAVLGATPAALGLIEGLADGLASFSKLFCGFYSDRLKRRKPLLVAGYAITAAGMASFGLASQWWHVLIGRVGAWIGRGARTPVRNVLLTEATTPATIGRAFGLERAMDSAGAMIGPALALLLWTLLGPRHFRWLFLCTLVPGLLCVLCVVLLVRERPHEPQQRTGLWSGLKQLPRPFRRYLLGVGIAGIGDFSKTLLILWATSAWTPRFGSHHAAMLAMAFYTGYNAVYTVSCYLSGGLADRFPRNRVLALGYAIAVIPAAALLWPGDSLGKFAIVFGFSGLYMGVWETLESSTSGMMLPAAVRGTGFGMLATVNGIGDFISSAAVGSLWVISPAASMIFVIFSAVIGAAVIAMIPSPDSGADADRSPPPADPQLNIAV